MIPALLMTASIDPNWSSAVAAIVAAVFGVETDVAQPAAAPPA
jgi:hypothetical protein